MIVKRKGWTYDKDHASYVVPRNATAEDLRAAIACWESGGAVSGLYVLALFRYWKLEGPNITSQSEVDNFEYVRRTLELARSSS